MSTPVAEMTPLEAVFAENPQEINLFLSNIMIGEVGTVYLQRHMKKYPDLRLLELRGSTIGRKGAEYLSKALVNHSCIQHLGLARCGIETQGMCLIVKSLFNTNIQTIDMEWNALQDSVAFELANLMKQSTSIVAISLERNDIRSDGVAALAEALMTNTSLRNLNLGFCKAGSHGAVKLGEMLKVNRTLLTLNLSTNAIYPDGAYCLAEALTVNNILQSLNLQHNQALDGFAGYADLQFQPSLRELNFLGNRLQMSLAPHFAQSLKSATGLIGLSLGRIGANDAVLNPILDILMSIVSLLTLDLTACALTPESSTSLGNVVTALPNLCTLNIDDNPLESIGCSIVAASVGQAYSLTRLTMNGCRMGHQGAFALATSIKNRRGLPLEELRIAHNAIGSEGFVAICDALCYHPIESECQLKHFDCSSNNLAGRAGIGMVKLLTFHKVLPCIIARENPITIDIGSTFITAELAVAFAGDVSNILAPAVQQSGQQESNGGPSKSSHGEVPPRSNFNGTSKIWMDTSPLGKSPHSSASPSRAIMEKERASSKPLIATASSPPRSTQLTVPTKSPSSSAVLLHSGDSEYAPGLAAMQVSPFRSRHELHDVSRNIQQLPITETQLRIQFSQVDTNGNGYLEAHEFEHFFQSYELVEVDPKHRKIKRLLSKYAKDGKIFFDEFSVIMLELLNM